MHTITTFLADAWAWILAAVAALAAIIYNPDKS